MLDNNPLTGLIGPLDRRDSWRWGTIMSHNPVRVRLDGDSETSLATPDCLVPVTTGDRVRVQIANRRMTVFGKLHAGTASTALPLRNGWQAYGTGYQAPQYEVFPDGRVQLHGMIKPGTKANNTVIAKVPASLAPSNRRVFVVGAGVLGAARVDVNADGEILLAVFGVMSDAEKITWLSLETVSW